MRNTHLLKPPLSKKKLVRQALFSDNVFAQIAALILLAESGDPESGWLLETLLNHEPVLKSGPRKLGK